MSFVLVILLLLLRLRLFSPFRSRSSGTTNTKRSPIGGGGDTTTRQRRTNRIMQQRRRRVSAAEEDPLHASRSSSSAVRSSLHTPAVIYNRARRLLLSAAAATSSADSSIFPGLQSPQGSRASLIARWTAMWTCENGNVSDAQQAGVQRSSMDAPARAPNRCGASSQGQHHAPHSRCRPGAAHAQ